MGSFNGCLMETLLQGINPSKAQRIYYLEQDPVPWTEGVMNQLVTEQLICRDMAASLVAAPPDSERGARRRQYHQESAKLLHTYR